MNVYVKSKYQELCETITTGEKHLAEVSKEVAAIWGKRELTEEARRTRVYALGQETDTKRLALFGKASAALKAIREDETFLRTFDVNAMQTACSIVTALDTDVTRDVLVSLIEPLRNSQQALASLRALCERRSIETSVFSEYMLCKYDEYKNGTPIPQAEYFDEAERYLQNYYCNHVGKVVPQTIVWIPNWVPRVDAQTLLNVLGQIAKVGGFDPILIQPPHEFMTEYGAKGLQWEASINAFNEAHPQARNW